MAKFGKSSSVTSVPQNVRAIVNATPDTTNKAGGEAYHLTPKFKLAFLAATTMLQDTFYRSANETMNEINRLITQIADPVFVAKLAVFIRNQYGMRSVTHYIAAQVAHQVKGQPWTKHFLDQVVRRPDDATEILSCYIHLHGRKAIPNSLKKGLGLSLGKFDEYSLGKYRGENNSLKLIDLVNLVHPKPTEKNAEALKKLVKGELRSSDTWETELSAAGQDAEGEIEKAANKQEAWARLIGERKLGYFALLRNMRNIMEQADEKTINAACEMLVDAKLIKKSLVLPFRFMTALKQFENCGSYAGGRKIQAAIAKAVEISLDNVPKFEGRTLIALDVSGSMTSAQNEYRNGKVIQKPAPIDIGSLFAAVIAKTNDADILTFDGSARYISYPLHDSVATITADIRRKATGGSTNFHAIFQHANQAYDRIVILSDMQGWVGHYCPRETFGSYCRKFRANPKIYSFDLAGLGTTQFPQDNVYTLAGFSDKTMELMGLLERDPRALLKQIEDISFEKKTE